MEALEGRLEFMRPFDTGRHVYVNWDPMIEHRVSHCDGLNPFTHPANQGAQMRYTEGMLPATLDILKRTLIFGITPFLAEEEVSRMTGLIRTAAMSATGVAA